MLSSIQRLASRRVHVHSQYTLSNFAGLTSRAERGWFLLHGSDCHFFSAGSSRTLRSPNSQLSVRMTLITEDKRLSDIWFHLGGILEEDKQRIQRKEISTAFREDVYMYLIHLAYILGVKDFSKLAPLAPSHQSPGLRRPYICERHQVTNFPSPGHLTLMESQQLHTRAHFAERRNNNLTRGGEDNLRVNYSPVRQSRCTEGMLVPTVGLCPPTSSLNSDARFQPS